MIDDLADEGTTIILSSHILPIVEEHADIVGVISNGQLVAEGAPSELQRRAETGKTRSLEDVFPRGNAGTPRRDAGARRRIGKPR